MICKMILLGTLYIHPSNIEKLEISVSNPTEQCVIVDKSGERENANMSCDKVVDKMNAACATPEFEDLGNLKELDI